MDDENKEVYMLGDLNCNLLDSNLSNVKMLQEIMQLYQLTQIIDDPTRVTKSKKSLLDVCITSSPDKIIQSGVVHLGISDHSLIYATRKLNSVIKGNSQNSVKFRNFRKFNDESFLSDLYMLPWVELDCKQNVDEMWECWKTLFLQVLDKHAPKRLKRLRKKGNVPWFNKSVKNKLFQRDHFKRVAIKTNNENDWKLYKSSRNAANIALRNAKREYYATKFLNNKTNPKYAWKTVNEILGRSQKLNIVNEINLPEKTVTSTTELINVFNDYFTDVGPKLAEKIEYEHNCSFRDFIPQHEPVERFIFQPVNVATVYRLITKLTISKATGIDEISAKVLKAAAPAIAEPLTRIFNMSIATDRFPMEWKAARVTPIFKKGQRTMLDNYRPISILPVVSKLMERILYDQMYDYLKKQNILSEHQFGFRQFHSTTTTLLDCTNEWYINMDRGLYIIVVLLDLKKAFDTVNHEIILRKFERYGFGNKALDLLSNYLTNRTQRCQLNGMLSDQRGITCGIPQGSILGPLLFIIYINDLPNCLKHTTPRMFADDTSLTAVGKTLNEAEEIANKDLKNIKVWLSSNKLSLNIAKTEYILIGSRSKINSMDVQPTVKIDTCPIKRVKSAKVLGVEIDENLNWEKHIEYIASKVSSGIGALKKLKEFVDRDTLVLVYNALIQPHFDYCCEVWDELGKGLGERLQKLQNRVARVIMNFKNEHGQSILARTALRWTSLEERRALMKAKLMYKTVNQLAPQRLCNIFQSSNTVNSYNLRGSSTGLFIPRPRTEFFKKSFSYSGAKLWNRIPENIRNSISYNSFCKNLFSSHSALLN